MRTPTDLERFANACEFPGVLDCSLVEKALREYVIALGVTRNVVRILPGWKLSDYPSFERAITLTLDDFAKRAGDASDASDVIAASDARDASDARAARAASAASAARDARAASDARALHRFAQWCVFRGGWWWSWDLSYLSTTYFGGLQNEKPDVVKWSKPLLDAFIAGAWLIYWTDETLYWVAKPTVHRDTTTTARRLHNEHHAALECDLENLYFWKGVSVPAFVVVRPDWITVKHIETEDNAEVRRVMIERYGQARYLVDSGAREIHMDDFGKLYRKEIKNDEPLVMVKVVNSTAEPDGSFKDYFIRVPPSMKRAKEAVAWSFGKTENEYAPAIET